MSTSFRPQTDGQKENVNQSVELYVRTFCNCEQDDWRDLLPLAEHTYNNSVTIRTGISPFYANYCYHPRTNWPTKEEVKDPANEVYMHYVHSIHELCKEGLEKACERMAKYFDQRVKEAPAYKVGDLVMLSGKNILAHDDHSVSLITSIMAHSKLSSVYPDQPFASGFPSVGGSTMCTMFPFWNHIVKELCLEGNCRISAVS